MSTKHASRRAALWWSCLGFVGCAVSPDTRLDDQPMSCTPVAAIYRLTSVDPSVRVANRLDLDGDGHPDDQLGLAHDAVVGFEPAFAVAPRIGARLATDTPWLVAVDRCGDEARVTIDQGVALSAADVELPQVLPRAVGTVDHGVLAARDGVARLPLITLADALGTSRAPGWAKADGLVVRATIDDAAIDGVFAAAVDPATARTELAAPIAAFLAAQGPDDLLRRGADADGDGTVTAAEVAATSTFRDVIVGDVVVRGAPATSIAFAFRAVRLR